MVYIKQEDILLMTEAKKLRLKYLNNFLYPTLVHKSRQWMQSLLEQRGVTVEHHFPNSNTNQPPTFSKCIIKTILSPKDWEFSTRQFP